MKKSLLPIKFSFHIFSVLLFLLPHVAQAGVIGSAPRVTSILTNILQFLLSIVGVLGIIGLVIAGALYFFAAGDERQLELAKRATIASVTGIMIALSGLVVIAALGKIVQ